MVSDRVEGHCTHCYSCTKDRDHCWLLHGQPATKKKGFDPEAGSKKYASGTVDDLGLGGGSASK